MRDWKTHNVEIAMTPELSTGEMVVERADQAFADSLPAVQVVDRRKKMMSFQ